MMGNQNEIEKLLASLDKFEYSCSAFCLINPEDLKTIGLKEFDGNVFFLETPHIDRGRAYLITEDNEVKKDLYNQYKNHPERFKRGQKRYSGLIERGEQI